MVLSNLEENANRLKLTSGDEKNEHLMSLLRAASKLRLEVSQAEREVRNEIRRILREQGIIADKSEDLRVPERATNFSPGKWEEIPMEAGRLPKLVRFHASERGSWHIASGYFCPNGCGWVGIEYPPAPMEGWSRKVLDPSTSRPCVVCDLPVARTPDVNYFHHY